MAPAKPAIGFEHRGIGEVLDQNWLQVPLNQREYSWEEKHVTDLLEDLTKAMPKGTYFLGTIVLTSGESDVPEVTDGQQRLATTTILLAAIRDYYLLRCAGQEKRARSIEESFLSRIDGRSVELRPRLRLNVDDQEFFERYILAPPDGQRQRVEAARVSHRRMQDAARLASEHMRAVVDPLREGDRPDRLWDWVEFLRDGVEVVILRVPEHLNAFVMFETLNDRGLRTSQADLLKNHLLKCAGSRIREAQQKWARMMGVLESHGSGDIVVTYLHHLLITKHGPTKANEVYEKVEGTVTSKAQAIDFLDELVDGANDYVALWNPDHPKWNKYGPSLRHSIHTINRDLRVEQIRPLMFAAAKHLPVSEAALAFRLFVCWSVRFLIVGGRGGLLDRNYALRAKEVGDGAIATGRDLIGKMEDIIPTDAEFEAAFASARVSLHYLARYYLRAMEQSLKGQDEPEWVPSDDQRAITLEHVLPENPEDEWSDMEPDVAAAYYRRIGNLALLQAKPNSDLGNSPFAQKKPVLAASGYQLTQWVAEEATWGTEQIDSRQKRLAELAVRTWPIRL